MKYAPLGRAGLQVSRLCLGTMNFGSYTAEADSVAIMDQALDLGINFFDTADVYGGRRGDGVTEQIVGRWLSLGGGRREGVVLATKVYGRMGDGPNDWGLSAYHIRTACERSLRRLRTDRIDLYQMHHVDRRVPWEEIWQALEQLVREGKVLYVGSSNFAGWQIAQASAAAAERHFLGIVSEQSLYNLAARTVELEVMPACRAHGVGVVPWSPLAGGLLAGGEAADGAGRRRSDRLRSRMERHREQLQTYETFCGEMGEQPATVAVAWLLQQQGVTAPIVGPRTVEQLTGMLRALEIELSQDDLRRLDEIWPGPGGEAPEAYAW
jgi:aryl-alcohol dehydrogenase-like predicted oxidoreductase